MSKRTVSDERYEILRRYDLAMKAERMAREQSVSRDKKYDVSYRRRRIAV